MTLVIYTEMSQLLKAWLSCVYRQNFRKLLNQDIYFCRSCSILRYSSKPKEDQLVRVAEIPVNEIKEPPIIFSRGEKKVISRDSKSSAATQLEILSAGLKRRQLQLYVEKWFKDHGFTSNSSSKVEFKTFGEVATIQNGNKHKRKKLEKKKKHDQNDIVETPPNKFLVLQKDESKKNKSK